MLLLQSVPGSPLSRIIRPPTADWQTPALQILMLPYVARKLLNITSDFHGGGKHTSCEELLNLLLTDSGMLQMVNSPDKLGTIDSSWSRRD